MAKQSTSPSASADTATPDAEATPPTAGATPATTPPPTRMQTAESTTTTYDFATGQPVHATQEAVLNPGMGQPQPQPDAQAAQAEAQPDRADDASQDNANAKLFTQDELEAIIKDRLDRQRRRYEQLAKSKPEGDEGEPESASEDKEPTTAPAKEKQPVQKPETPDYAAELKEIQSQLANVSVEVRQARVATAIAVESQRQGIDAGLAARLIDDATIEFVEGQPKPESVQKALTSLVAQYPNLRTMPPLTASNPARSGQVQRNDSDRWQDYFGGGNSAFWGGGGVANTEQ